MEASFIKYKIKISIEPVDTEENHSSLISNHEFEFLRHEANYRYNSLIKELQSKFFKAMPSKIWITTQSIDKNQFGYIYQKTDWGGYSAFFPNGIGCLNTWDPINKKYSKVINRTPCYREFLQKFISERFEGNL